MYRVKNFILHSDFEIRIIREEDENGDIDLFIPIDNRTINLYLPFVDEENIPRIQLSQIRSIVIRFNSHEDNNWASIYFLNHIDLLSHVLNFQINYGGYELLVRKEEYSVSFIMEKCKKK